jgi:hypothetical protein
LEEKEKRSINREEKKKRSTIKDSWRPLTIVRREIKKSWPEP